jgi:hypothetical protein
MPTGTLQYLHTSDAYRATVARLMVDEANFVATALDLPERVPAPGQGNSLEWDIPPVPMGISGCVTSSNYSFAFLNGRLYSVTKHRWLENISPPVRDILELAQRPSRLDNNGALELAKKWLERIGIDIERLESEGSPIVFQIPARRRDAAGRTLEGVSNNVRVPLFQIGWGGNGAPRRILTPQRPGSNSAVLVEILGTTTELIRLQIRAANLSRRPALQLTNAEELLGPVPEPRHFVEELFGGRVAYETIANPDHVQAWLLTSSYAEPSLHQKEDRAGPINLTRTAAKAFSETLLDFDSYSWARARGQQKGCIIDYGARLRFTRDQDFVDVHLCFECGVIGISYQGHARQEDFDPSYDALVRALQAVFPSDPVVRKLQRRSR